MIEKIKMIKANFPCISQQGFETEFALLNWYNVPCNECLMNIQTWFNIKCTMDNVSWPQCYFSASPKCVTHFETT